MRRREFIAGLGSAAVWPLAARAQQPAMPTIGYLGANSPEATKIAVASFRQGLGDAGFFEGQNLTILFRWAELHYERLPELAADLVRRQVAVIFANNAVNATFAAKNATKEIPIVFNVGSDPVELGLVASLSRPGGNLTGVTTISRELLAKRVALLRELLPATTTIGLLVNPDNPNAEIFARDMRALARTGGWVLQIAVARSEADFDAAFATFVQAQVGAFLIATDGLFVASSAKIAALAAVHRIAAVHSVREFVQAGGLMSYGASQREATRQCGVYVGRILRGEKPADLPVMQPVKFDFAINLKTAKALGLTVPLTLQVSADEVIE
jgi:putative ABC transport system substrate-binding protein